MPAIIQFNCLVSGRFFLCKLTTRLNLLSVGPLDPSTAECGVLEFDEDRYESGREWCPIVVGSKKNGTNLTNPMKTHQSNLWFSSGLELNLFVFGDHIFWVFDMIGGWEYIEGYNQRIYRFLFVGEQEC